MAKNYYEILGISEEEKKLPTDEFQKVLKNKWRKLSLQYHPDRQQDKSEEEKKEAEEKFKEIAEANEVLGDENKRRQYDRYGSVGRHAGQGMSVEDIIQQMRKDFGVFFDTEEHVQIQKGRTLKVGVNVTFEEIYNNAEIEIKYKRNVHCTTCGGTGSKDGKVEKCSYCRGTGRIIQQFNNGYGITINETTCPYCKGRGETFKEPCERCNGSGLETVEETKTIKIPKGCHNRSYIIIEGDGDAAPNNGGINGDLIVIFNVVENLVYTVDPNNPYNIIRNLEVPVLDCITGCEKEIMGINGKKYKIKILPNTLHNHNLRLKGNGLENVYGERGDMYVCIKMKMPQQPLTDKENKLINDLKENKNFQ